MHSDQTILEECSHRENYAQLGKKMGKVLFALEKAAGHHYHDHPECPERVAVIGQYLYAQLQLDTCLAVSGRALDCQSPSSKDVKVEPLPTTTCPWMGAGLPSPSM